MLKIVKRSRQN